MNKKIIQREFTSNFETKSINNKKQIKYTFIKSSYFRELCMMINTKKGKQIRKYYIKLEELFKNYVKYQMTANKIIINKMNTQNKYLKKISKVNYKKKHTNMLESVYIFSNEEESKNGMFKPMFSLIINHYHVINIICFNWIV